MYSLGRDPRPARKLPATSFRATDLLVAFRTRCVPLPLRRLLLALALLAAAPRGAAAQNVPGAAEVDFGRARREYTADALRDYNRFASEFSAAWQERNLRELMARFSANPTVVVSDSVLIRGQNALRTFFEASVPAGSQIRLGITDFVAGEGLSFGTGLFAYQPAAEADALTGTYFLVLTQEGGRWRIRSLVFTPSLPLAASAPATGS